MLAHLPEEIVQAVCSHLPHLDDVFALQEAVPTLTRRLTRAFWGRISSLSVQWQSTAQTSSIEVTSRDGRYWHLDGSHPRVADVLARCQSIHTLVVEIDERAVASWSHALLDPLLHAAAEPRVVALRLRRSTSTDAAQVALLRTAQKTLIRLASSMARSIDYIRVETSPEDFVVLQRVDSKCVALHHQHSTHLATHTQLLVPLFHAVLSAWPDSSTEQLMLTVARCSTSEIELALQYAFLTAVPLTRRERLCRLVLRLADYTLEWSSTTSRVVSAVRRFVDDSALGARNLRHVQCHMPAQSAHAHCCTQSAALTLLRCL